MKGAVTLIFVVLFACGSGIGQKIDSTKAKMPEPLSAWNAPRCKPNSDDKYDRGKVLTQVVEMLNGTLPTYATSFSPFYFHENELAGPFFIYDLTDISNVDSLKSGKCIEFIDGHIYHISPYNFAFAVSHIVILEDGDLKIFRGLNCPAKGDSIENVLDYLTPKLSADNNKDLILDRVRNYRAFGTYSTRTDPQTILRCADVVNPK